MIGYAYAAVRRLASTLARWGVHPATLGAAYLLGLVALAARRAHEGDAALAGQTRAIHAAVDAHFGDEVTRMTLALVGVSVAIGSTLGGVAGVTVDARRRLLGYDPLPVWVRGLHALALVALVHGLAEAYAIAETPQLFARAFYEQGGLGWAVQVVLTDALGRGGVVAIAFALGVWLLVGPVKHWPRWPARVARLRRRLTRALEGPAPLTLTVMCGLALGALALQRGLPVALARPAYPVDPAHPNVLILAADSLRADRIDPRVAPRLSALADRGARFDRAYVSLPRTFPSWVTLLTGRHPHHHGIRSMFPRWEERAKDFDALPERLARAGYSTAVVSDFAGDIFDRIDLGWAETQVPTFDFRQLIRQRSLEPQTPLLPFLQSRLGRAVFPVLRELNDAADPTLLADDAKATLARMEKAGRPFFLTVFFSTAHFPYAAPAPYYGRFTRQSYRGRYKYDKPVGLEREAPPDADDVAQVRALYDGAVAGIDEAAGEILDALEASGQAKRTIVVVLADHGETLFENGHGEGHGDHLFGDEGTHVPFIVYDPRAVSPSVSSPPSPHRVASVVRDVDVAPTLYELTGVAPPEDLDGLSLAPVVGGAEPSPRLAFAETGLWVTEDVSGLDGALRLPYPGVAAMTEVDHDHGDEVVLSRDRKALAVVAKHRMVRDERWKLVYAPTRKGARYFLYDTVADPGEARDVSAEHPVELARLQGELWPWLLQDADMMERGGVLVPRDARTLAARDESANVIRVDTPAAEP